MKKVLTFILIMVLVASMAVPAFAATASSGGSAEDLTPEVVPPAPAAPAAPEEEEEIGNLPAPGEVTTPKSDFLMDVTTSSGTQAATAPVIVPEEELVELPEEKQEVYAKAQETITAVPDILKEIEAAEAAEAGEEPAADAPKMVVKYNFYFQTEESVTASFPAEGHKKVVYMQYENDKWVKRETIMNEDDTVTVVGLTEGPVVVLVEDENIYLVTADSSEYGIVSMENVEDLPEEAQAALVSAKDDLADAVPEEMAVRYFFHFSTEEACTAVFSAKNLEDVVYVQYVDGQWIELETEMNEDGTITVLGIVDGPMAVFVKRGE